MKKNVMLGIMLTLLFAGVITLAFTIQPTKASGTIYIRADGNIDPPTAPIQRIGDTYTFTGNIYDSIVVQRNNIVIDGNGYTIQGTGWGVGIDLSGINNVTIRNTNIQNFFFGIRLFESASNNSICSNNVTNNGNGIRLSESSNSNNIYGNEITNNKYHGIVLSSSYYNNIVGNRITSNGNNGVYFAFSSNNSIIGNKITSNDRSGIYLDNSLDNIIIKNKITNNIHWGMELYSSLNNNIVENDITNNGNEGICLRDSSNYNSIIGCNITSNDSGIWLYYSSNNIITQNKIANNNYWGISLYYSSNNRFYHNSFINNAMHVVISASINIWDDGYPSGGNYWSDYTERYPEASEIDGSGIWDTPYVIDEDNQDRYPLMYPYGTQTYKLTITTTDGGTTTPSPGVHTYANGTVVFVTAILNTNYRFMYWILDGANAGSANPIQVLMTANHTLEAVFTQITYQLTISATTGGTTDPTPGTYTYVNGTRVSVTAIPEENCVFGYWLLDGVNVGSENPIEVLMTANHTLHAVFLQVFQLTITATPGGTTNPSPGTYNYTVRTEINVTAIPNTGYSFAYWFLDGEARTENPITITMDENHILEAYFVDDIRPEIGEPSQSPPPENVKPNQDVTVTVTVTDRGSGVKNVTLWYSLDNGTIWTTLNMTELAAGTYTATIQGREYCTWVTYKIIAYDNEGNMAVKDNNGYNYQYHVIPEFPSNTLALAILILSTLTTAAIRKTKRKQGSTHFFSLKYIITSVSHR